MKILEWFRKKPKLEEIPTKVILPCCDFVPKPKTDFYDESNDWIKRKIYSYKNSDEKWIRELCIFVEDFQKQSFSLEYKLNGPKIDFEGLIKVNAIEFVINKITAEEFSSIKLPPGKRVKGITVI